MVLSGQPSVDNPGYTPFNTFVGVGLDKCLSAKIRFHSGRSKTCCYWIKNDSAKYLFDLEWLDIWTIQQRSLPLIKQMITTSHHWSRK